MSNAYFLTEDREAVPCSTLEWAKQLEDMSKSGTRHVAECTIDGYWISTVWLGLNHQHFSNLPPLLFETMIFKDEWIDYCSRYTTWDEAVAGHQRAIEYVQRGCKDE